VAETLGWDSITKTSHYSTWPRQSFQLFPILARLTAETDRAATQVVDRKQHAVDEVVAESRAILPLTHQSGRLQLAATITALGPHLQPIPDGRMKADAEFRDHLRAQMALIGDVLAGTGS